jgi:hypothetical protein
MNETEFFKDILSKMTLNINGNGNVIIHYFEIGENLSKTLLMLICFIAGFFLLKYLWGERK